MSVKYKCEREPMSLLMLVSTVPSALKVMKASIYRLVAEEACTSFEEEEEEECTYLILVRIS